MTGELDPLAPEKAAELLLDHRREETRVATRRKHQSALGVFVNWTDQADIENLNALGGRDLLEFKAWQKNQSGNKRVSLNGTLGVIRVFLGFCERIDAVEHGLAEAVPLPNVPPDEEISDDVPTDAEAKAMRPYYRKFESASLRQTQLELITEIGL